MIFKFASTTNKIKRINVVHNYLQCTRFLRVVECLKRNWYFEILNKKKNHLLFGALAEDILNDRRGQEVRTV